MSISRVFSRIDGTHYKKLSRPRPIIPRPKNLSQAKRNQKPFFKSILPDARTAGGKTAGACVQINGEWSSGKTLFLAFIAEERYEEEGLGGICNYPLKVPGYEFLNDDFTRIEEGTGDTLYGIDALQEVYNSIIQIDEFRAYVDSYMSKSQKSLFISNLTSDFGKQGNDFYYTNQHHNAAPTRVRVNISFVVYPQYDDMTGWVHVYLFHSIAKFLWKDPFWYFGFYAPDYWDVYDTKFKIQDYTMKFRPEPYINKFFDWIPDRNISKRQVKALSERKLRNALKLFNSVGGHSLSPAEIALIMTDMEYSNKWNG